jgi:exoribonuclease R
MCVCVFVGVFTNTCAFVCMQGKVVTESGLVMKVRKNGAVVFVPRFGIEGIVYVTSWKEEREGKNPYLFDEAAQRLSLATDPSLTIRVFDEVREAGPVCYSCAVAAVP